MGSLNVLIIRKFFSLGEAAASDHLVREGEAAVSGRSQADPEAHQTPFSCLTFSKNLISK